MLANSHVNGQIIIDENQEANGATAPAAALKRRTRGNAAGSQTLEHNNNHREIGDQGGNAALKNLRGTTKVVGANIIEN